MYSISQRANSVFAFLITTIMGLVAAIAVTSPFLGTGQPDIRLRVNEIVIKNGRFAYYHEPPPPVTEMAFISFDLEADLRPLFTWNTKQLFLYVSVEYETPSHDTNQVVIYDDILLPEDAVLRRPNLRAEYPFADFSPKLRHVNATLRVGWDVTPKVGIVTGGKSAGIPVAFGQWDGEQGAARERREAEQQQPTETDDEAFEEVFVDGEGDGGEGEAIEYVEVEE